MSRKMLSRIVRRFGAYLKGFVGRIAEKDISTQALGAQLPSLLPLSIGKVRLPGSPGRHMGIKFFLSLLLPKGASIPHKLGYRKEEEPMTQASIAELVESLGPRNTDRYNLHPIGIKFKAYKDGPSKEKEKKTSLASPGLYESLSRGEPPSGTF